MTTTPIPDFEDEPDLGELRRLLDAATPTPWRWEVNLKTHTVQICGGPRSGFGRYDLTVVSFDRYGMHKAAPVFWTWTPQDSGFGVGEPHRADAVSSPVPGREHHAGWFRTIDHPNAAVITAAVNALPYLLSEHERAETLAREKAELVERVRVLSEALKPFAAYAIGAPTGAADARASMDLGYVQGAWNLNRITAGDLHRAARALSPEHPGDDNG